MLFYYNIVILFDISTSSPDTISITSYLISKVLYFMFLKANKASNILFIFANIYFKLKYCIVSSITETKKYKAVTKIYFATALYSWNT